jgi:hypothetical protein
MSEVLIPPMRNIVRRIVIECSTPRLADGKVEDPAIRAARMDLEDVLTELREEEGVWFDGFDWAERRRNNGRELVKRERENGGGSDASSTSSCSRSSNGTSPVLSTTTLQTTPSPPPIPIGEEGGEKGEGECHDEVEDFSRTAVPKLTKPVTIAIAPVLDPPKLLRAIPYVPVTVSHMPQFSLEAFRTVSSFVVPTGHFWSNLLPFRCGEKHVHPCTIVDARFANVLWPRRMLQTATNTLLLSYLPKLRRGLHRPIRNIL